MAAQKLHTGLVAFMLIAAGGPFEAQDATVETQLVDAMNKLYGVHPGFRANHAKGVVVTGSFKAAPQAARLSKAVLFAGGTIPVTVRFSDATGVPDIPDDSDLANPHGMAIKFHLPDGGETDMVLCSIKFFPVSNGADFRDMLLAIAASPPNAPKPTELEPVRGDPSGRAARAGHGANTRQFRRRRILWHQSSSSTTKARDARCVIL